MSLVLSLLGPGLGVLVTLKVTEIRVDRAESDIKNASNGQESLVKELSEINTRLARIEGSLGSAGPNHR